MAQHGGKRVIIIGGASGIGLATAKLLQKEGARVMVTGLGDASLEKAQAELGPDAIVAKSNASKLAEIDALTMQVRSELGGLDALFVCAGRNLFAPFEQVTEEQFDQLFEVNAKGPYFTIQKLAPLVADGGAIVVVTSVANVIGQPMISAYAATKAAARSMVRSIAQELLPRGIRVNAVSPGPIESGILDKSMSKEEAEQTRKQMTDENPMRRFGTPEEVAKAMIFLAFEATYNTGAELAVDGGGTQL